MPKGNLRVADFFQESLLMRETVWFLSLSGVYDCGKVFIVRKDHKNQTSGVFVVKA